MNREMIAFNPSPCQTGHSFCEVKASNLVKDKKGNKEQWKSISM